MAMEFERKLYVIGKQLEHESEERLYFASLSHRTVVYKGMLIDEGRGAAREVDRFLQKEK